MTILGDSRAKYFNEDKPEYMKNLSAWSRGGMTLARFQAQMPYISSDIEIVVLTLFQCEFTMKEGLLVKPNPNVDFSEMLARVEEIEDRISRQAPQAYIFWTIPIVRKFKIPEEVKEVREKKEMAQRIREWMKILKDNGHYVMDLSKTFEAGEDREAYTNRYTKDGIHPTRQGTLRFFQQLRRQIITIGILKKIINNRKNTRTVVTYESV